MKRNAQLISTESQWRDDKRSTRLLRHWRRLEQLKEEVLTDWLAAVERDDRTDPVMVDVDTSTRQQVAHTQGG
jgi:hypothetical protein